MTAAVSTDSSAVIWVQAQTQPLLRAGLAKAPIPIICAFCPTCRKAIGERLDGGTGGHEGAERRARTRVCQHMWWKHPECAVLTRPGWDAHVTHLLDPKRPLGFQCKQTLGQHPAKVRTNEQQSFVITAAQDFSQEAPARGIAAPGGSGTGHLRRGTSCEVDLLLEVRGASPVGNYGAGHASTARPLPGAGGDQRAGAPRAD